MKIEMISTGGTLLAVQGMNGLAPGQSVGNLVIPAAAQAHDELTKTTLFDLDSSNMRPEDWQKIAEHIRDNYDVYDAFIIIHGTDTMAYTASALSFMLQNLQKAVVLTGSQVPYGEPNSDAAANLDLAVSVCHSEIQGVVIAFADKVIRGCKSTKSKTKSYDAFESVSYPELAVMKSGHLHVYEEKSEEKIGKGSFFCSSKISDKILLIKLYPGFDPKILDCAAALQVKGLILEGFGIGGAPSLPDKEWSIVPRVRNLIDQGVVIVMKSQCHYEGCDFSIYAAGNEFGKCGVLEAGGMTAEAAVTKLMWAIGNADDPEEIKKIFNTDYCGEFLEV